MKIKGKLSILFMVASIVLGYVAVTTENTLLSNQTFFSGFLAICIATILYPFPKDENIAWMMSVNWWTKTLDYLRSI